MSSFYFRKCVTLWRLTVKKFLDEKRKRMEVRVSFRLEVGNDRQGF